jgi:hypothetical protein
MYVFTTKVYLKRRFLKGVLVDLWSCSNGGCHLVYTWGEIMVLRPMCGTTGNTYAL